MYMDLLHGVTTQHVKARKHELNLNSNWYGGTQVGRVWNHHLCSKLIYIVFVPSLVDAYVFYCSSTICVVCVDNNLCIDLNAACLNQLIKDIQGTGFKIEDQGNPADYMGVRINKDATGYYNFCNWLSSTSSLSMLDSVTPSE